MNYIDQIVNYIIRPTRDIYKPRRLGDNNFSVYKQTGEEVRVHREERVILNKQNQSLHVSYYQPIANKQNSYQQEGLSTYHSNIFQYKNNRLVDQFKARNHQKNCVIYLHANNGSRIEGLTYLKKLLEAELNVCLFDCSGSGISQGQFVTLGLKQSKDLDCVVKYLTQQKAITQIALWGRSMGASTAMIYASKSNGPIKSLILDSPFKDLQKLIKQIASDRTGLPKIFFNPIIPFIRNQIKSKTGYSIQQLKMKNYLQSSSETNSNKKLNKNKLQEIPALFLVSKNDKLVKLHHGQKLFKRYPCSDKLLEYIQNQHHESRKSQIIQKCIHFIVRCFRNDQLKKVSQITASTNVLNNQIPSLNFRKQTKMKNGNYHSHNRDIDLSERSSAIKNQWINNSSQQLNIQRGNLIAIQTPSSTVSQEEFYHKMKTGLKNICGPDNCQQYNQQSYSQRKMLRNSSSMSDLISQHEQIHKIQPIKLSFVKKSKTKTTLHQPMQPNRMNNTPINQNTNTDANDIVNQQKGYIHQYVPTDPIRQNQETKPIAIAMKISMSRQASRSKRYNLINGSKIIKDERQFQQNNISIDLGRDSSQTQPQQYLYSNGNNAYNPNTLEFLHQHNNKFQWRKQYQTDRKNAYSNFNSKNNFNSRIYQSPVMQKTYFPPTPQSSIKAVQFQNCQSSKKKISLSSTMQNIQIKSPFLDKNRQQRQRYKNYQAKTENYQKNYQSMMNNFSPKRFFE